MKKIVLFILIFSSFNSYSQKIIKCITDEMHANLLKLHPELKIEEERGNQIALLASKELNKAGIVKYIPVVFHVIHKYGFENITQAQINDCIRVINEDFRKKSGTNGGSSTDSRAADVEIEFRLAQFDPSGNPTDGVNRIYNPSSTDNAGEAAKTLSYWDSNKYYNIWVVNTIYTSGSGTILGYATFPSSRASNPTRDGIIIRADQAGAIGNAMSSQVGRTVTHESGHWLGLYHTFQDGCVGGTTANCASQGDRVCDTPPLADATYGCPSDATNTCSNDVPNLPDNIHNYMDYVDGTCMNMFTAGQVSRVNSQVASYRSNAYSTTNLSGSGIGSDGSYITLSPSSIAPPINFNFTAWSGSNWAIENLNNSTNGWALNTSVGLDDSRCMWIRTFNNNVTNTRDGFYTANFNLSQTAKPVMKFYVAYAKKLEASNDKLNVYISNNYGRTETFIKTVSANEMLTAGVMTTEFSPTSSQWKQINIDLSDYKTFTNARIRFELQALRGNNLYLDNFSIENATGISELLQHEMNFSFSPNPSIGNAVISFENKSADEINISLFDMSGKLISILAENNFAAGKHEINFERVNIQSGIYFLNVKTTEGSFAYKVVLE